jgi:hypothetical protein
MLGDDFLDQRKSNSSALIPSCAAAFYLGKAVKDPL